MISDKRLGYIREAEGREVERSSGRRSSDGNDLQVCLPPLFSRARRHEEERRAIRRFPRDRRSNGG